MDRENKTQKIILFFTFLFVMLVFSSQSIHSACGYRDFANDSGAAAPSTLVVGSVLDCGNKIIDAEVCVILITNGTTYAKATKSSSDGLYAVKIPTKENDIIKIIASKNQKVMSKQKTQIFLELGVVRLDIEMSDFCFVDNNNDSYNNNSGTPNSKTNVSNNNGAFIKKCGDRICDSNETLNCPQDCGCPKSQTFVNNKCVNNCVDGDGDNYFVCTSGCYVNNTSFCSDCNDNNASIRPGANETCNGIDDNCNNKIDEDDVCITLFVDNLTGKLKKHKNIPTEQTIIVMSGINKGFLIENQQGDDINSISILIGSVVSSKKIYVFFNENDNTTILEVNNTLLKTNKTLKITSNAIFLNNTNEEVKIMPDVASEIALNQLKLHNWTIELKDTGNNYTNYIVEGKEDKKLFWIFPVEINAQIEINIEDGTVIIIRRSWWSFLTF